MRACLRLFLAFAFVLPCGTALAQNLVSGGATLPAPLYQDAMACLLYTSSMEVIPPSMVLL